MKDKLRLLLFEECNRDCEGCCNKDWDLQSIPTCDDYTPYRLIMLTGGEPMLRPDVIRSAVSDIRSHTDAPIYLYTAMTHGLDDILPIIDGLTLTIHEADDVPDFVAFEKNAQNLASLAERGSLRLNVFEEAGDVPCGDAWKVKSNMHWIKDCPLPDGEVLMRYQ